MEKIKQIRISEDDLFKHCKNNIIQNSKKYTVKKIFKPMLSQYHGNKKIYRKNICVFEIPGKR